MAASDTDPPPDLDRGVLWGSIGACPRCGEQITVELYEQGTLEVCGCGESYIPDEGAPCP